MLNPEPPPAPPPRHLRPAHPSGGGGEGRKVTMVAPRVAPEEQNGGIGEGLKGTAVPECLTTEHLEQAKVDSLVAAAVAAAEEDVGDNNDVEGEDEENDDGDVLQETIAQVLAEEFEWNEGIHDEEGEGGEEEDEEAETPEEAQKRVEELNSVGFCTGSHYQYTWDPHRNSLAAAAAASAVRMDLVCSHVS